MKMTSTSKLQAIIAVLIFLIATETKAQSEKGWSSKWGDDRAFIENKGQFYIREGKTADKPVLYGMDASFSRIFFHQNGVTFNFTQKLRPIKNEDHKKENKFLSEEEWREEEREEHAAVLRTDEVGYTWEDANPDAEIITEEQTANYYCYSFYSGGTEKTENYIKGYKKITYKNLYPQIDIEFMLHPENGVKYSIIIHPGGDVTKVKMHYTGRPQTDFEGNIRIGTLFGDIVDHAPVTFYSNDHQQNIPSWFISEGNIVTFGVGEYDHNKTIIIDPWSSTPTLTNSNKIWETETSSAGDAFIYGGDTFIKLIKYNSAGVIQWTYTSPWDSANYWIGGFITHPNGESYMTSGSNGEIRKITTAGGVAWSNNPNGFTSYEYWSLSFNCDLTKLVVGGSRLAFSIPFPVLRGVVININLTNGSQSGVTVVGYGSTTSIPPNVQEVSSICFSPNGNYYFLTLDTVGSINSALTTINFKTPSAYSFDYYVPGYGFGTKQPISCIRADANALYTINGSTLHKRNLNTGAIIASASIPGGSYTPSFLGRFVNGNGGIDIDAAGNIYVGSTTGVTKFDQNLNVISTVATAFAVYDVDVNNNGEVIACGWSGGTGTVQAIPMSAGSQLTYICSTSVPLSVTTTQTNVSCNALCNGTASVTVAGGTSPYSYVWTPSGGNAASATGLCAGTYTCTITDNVGATTTASFNITQPTALSIGSVLQTNVNCNGGNNGTASLVAAGGAGSYTYNWTPGNPAGNGTAQVTGLTAGTWTCTITDANGCTTTQIFTITEPTPIVPTIASFTDATCGNNDGSASVSVSGGTGPYSYNWTPSGGNASSAINLAAGSYSVIVTDAANCTASTTVAIATIGAATVTVQSTSNVTCFGQSDGSATVSVTGNGPFTYNWSPTGGNGASANNLPAGIYTITVTDASNCTSTQTLSITEPIQLSSGTSFTDETCNNSNGTATATPSGGTGPYTYLWNNSMTTSQISGLTAGNYSVVITDANGCNTSSTVTVASAGGPSVVVSSVVNVTCFGGASGSATANASSGQAPYTYSWSPTGGNAATANNLSAGTYTVTVTDSNGCTSTQTQVLTEPTAIVAATSSTSDDCNSGNGTASVQITGGTPGYALLWNNGNTNDTITALTAGSYTCTITDANGCTTLSTVNVGSSGSANAQAGSDVTITVGQTALLSGSGGGTYSWSPSSSLDCDTCQMPMASPTITTTYVLTVTDASGCTDVDTVVVYVDIACGDIFLPNAFSPNNDGQNDVYYVRGNCIASLQFEIYNRWGELVFSTDRTSQGWDGTWRGQPCETAVFTYFIRATLLDGTDYEDEGNISLIK